MSGAGHGKPHKDCPFTMDEMDAFKAALYSVNTSFHCCNPAAFSWVTGYQRWQHRKSNPRGKHP